jgi:hypothetical protein
MTYLLLVVWGIQAGGLRLVDIYFSIGGSGAVRRDDDYTLMRIADLITEDIPHT